MKHLSKFNEELDYKRQLELQKKAREEFEKARLEEIENRRKQTSGKYLSELEEKSMKQKQLDEQVEERKVLADRTIQGILSSQHGKTDFKDRLIELLNDYGF
jgi:hypothetical protein